MWKIACDEERSCVCVWQTCAVHFLKRLVQWLFQMFKCHFYPLSCWFLRLYLDWLCRLSEKHWRLAGWIKDLTDNFVVEFDWFAATVNYVVRCHCAATCLRWLRGVILRKQAAAEEAGCPDWRVDKIHVRIEKSKINQGGYNIRHQRLIFYFHKNIRNWVLIFR